MFKTREASSKTELKEWLRVMEEESWESGIQQHDARQRKQTQRLASGYQGNAGESIKTRSAKNTAIGKCDSNVVDKNVEETSFGDVQGKNNLNKKGGSI